MSIAMHHPDLDDAAAHAVNDDQAAHLETLGWVRAEPAEVEEVEQVEETFDGTASSFGADLELITSDGIPLSVVPDGTVDDVLAWVDVAGRGGWPERARAALDAEQGSDHPRKTITEPLTAALNPED